MNKETSPFAYYTRLAKLDRFQTEHPGEEISLSVAANVVGLEKKYFSKYFLQKTGLHFRDWIVRQKIVRAAELLETHDYSIVDLTFAVGFRSVRTFERNFKKWTGMTPSSFRRVVRPANSSPPTIRLYRP